MGGWISGRGSAVTWQRVGSGGNIQGFTIIFSPREMIEIVEQRGKSFS